MASQASQDAAKPALSFKCWTCPTSFSNRNAMWKHLQLHPDHKQRAAPKKTPSSQTRSKKVTVAEEKSLHTFPDLHGDVVAVVAHVIEPPEFHDKVNDPDWIEEYSTNVVGRFRCKTTGCRAGGWSSGIVSTVIRSYPPNAYNAVVYSQRCKACKRVGTLEVDKDTYVERISRRLQIWAGIQLERVPFTYKDRPPHESALCEGCKHGYCRERLRG